MNTPFWNRILPKTRGRVPPLKILHGLWAPVDSELAGWEFASTDLGGIFSFRDSPVYAIPPPGQRLRKFAPSRGYSLRVIEGATLPEGPLASPYELTSQETETSALKVIAFLGGMAIQAPALLTPDEEGAPYSRKPRDLSSLITRNFMRGALGFPLRSQLSRYACIYACSLYGLMLPLPLGRSPGYPLEWEKPR